MTVRFFILQSHYRSTLDFSNEALEGAEKGLKRLWEAYEWMKKYEAPETKYEAKDEELDKKVRKLVAEFTEFMDDDLNTAKVLANLFELVPVINSIKENRLRAEIVKVELAVVKNRRRLNKRSRSIDLTTHFAILR